MKFRISWNVSHSRSDHLDSIRIGNERVPSAGLRNKIPAVPVRCSHPLAICLGLNVEADAVFRSHVSKSARLTRSSTISEPWHRSARLHHHPVQAGITRYPACMATSPPDTLRYPIGSPDRAPSAVDRDNHVAALRIACAICPRLRRAGRFPAGYALPGRRLDRAAACASRCRLAHERLDAPEACAH